MQDRKMPALRYWLLAALLLLSCNAMGGRYTDMQIVSPAQDEVIHDNEGSVAVSVNLTPAVDADGGDRIILLLDNRVMARAANGKIALHFVDRGSHTLQAEVRAADGKVLIRSQPVTFQMWRASRHFAA